MDCIIIYNAKSDFIVVYDKGQAEAQVADLVKEGYIEIEVYEAEQVDFKIKNADITIALAEGKGG